MAFITRGSLNSRHIPSGVRIALWLGLFGLALGSGIANAGAEFKVRSAETHLSSHVYLLNASIDYEFSERALDALANGVPLTIRLDIEVKRKRSYWFNEDIASLEQRYQIQYHALSGRHIVRNLNSGASEAFPSLESALASLGEIRDFPLLDENLIDPREHYRVYLKASLDIESLPSPLRPLAYLTPAWWLGSDWYSWSLRH